MIADALDAFSQIFAPPFRRVMWKSLGLTAAILALAGISITLQWISGEAGGAR